MRTRPAVTSTGVEPQRTARLSTSAVITGLVVALGAMTLIGSIVLAAFALAGVEVGFTPGDAAEIGVGAVAAFILVQFLSYLWGGYTAARMGGGLGVGHGLLVPLAALVLAAIAGGALYAAGLDQGAPQAPEGALRFLPSSTALMSYGMVLTFGSLLAMFVGGLIGGISGARWHERFLFAETERTIYPDEKRERFIDLREDNEAVTHH